MTTNRSEAAKIGKIFHLIHFADTVRCVALCINIMNGFLMTQTDDLERYM